MAAANTLGLLHQGDAGIAAAKQFPSGSQPCNTSTDNTDSMLGLCGMCNASPFVQSDDGNQSKDREGLENARPTVVVAM